jgi:hypothetical protein
VVEKAIILFRSFSYRPQAAPYYADIPPSHVIIIRPVVQYSSYGLQRINRYTPAVTMVQECRKELTGVGPSIALGSHVD